MENIYPKSGMPLVWFGAESSCLALTAASLGQSARLTSAGPNPCETREEGGPALLEQAVKLLRKWLSVLAPLTEGFSKDVQH